MSRSISRDSFDELKNYLAVHLQQGRVILDSDWNESQDIAQSLIRRLTGESVGDGSPNKGFLIASLRDANLFLGGALSFFLSFPGNLLDDLESAAGWKLSSPLGSVRISQDRLFEGRGFLRVSGHPSTVEVVRDLASPIDLSSAEFVTFRYRISSNSAGTFAFLIEDTSGNRSIFTMQEPGFTQGVWLSLWAGPLDLSFRIITETLTPMFQGSGFAAPTITFVGAKSPATLAISAGAPPAGLTLAISSDHTVAFNGAPATAGTFSFTLKLTDAAGKNATKAYTLVVNPAPAPNTVVFNPTTSEILAGGKFEVPTGTPADLTRVKRYGFRIFQDASHPLTWDFDALHWGSTALFDKLSANNFAIRGSDLSSFSALSGFFLGFFAAFLPTAEKFNASSIAPIFQLLATYTLKELGADLAGRFYISGMPCLQIEDMLYSDQADPNDPALLPPPAGTVRRDLVYLDVWKEAVTYIEDPDIREIALGGPDTSTRAAVRQQVRVSPGIGEQAGIVPRTGGTGLGTLQTSGSYTGTENRLYRVEIDSAGGIGTATLRWSDDNASTLQRIIEPVPPGSTTVFVEDASAFHPGDPVLLRKRFGSERHVIATISGNVITLANPTGTQLASFPANSRVPDFQTFSLKDKPRIERWNAFNIAIPADPLDASVSSLIPLNDGVAIRFGGQQMVVGDYWNFRVRYLSGDEFSGIDPVTRIQPLNFQRPHGVFHRYAPLALITRDGSDPRPEQIKTTQDRRPRSGNSITTTQIFSRVVLAGSAAIYVGGVPLSTGGLDSRYLVYWSSDLFMSAAPVVNSTFSLEAALYSDMMTNPATDQTSGNLNSQKTDFAISRKPVGVEVPIRLLTSVIPETTFSRALSPPTSVQLFLRLSSGAGFSLELTNIVVTVIEMKKSL